MKTKLLFIITILLKSYTGYAQYTFSGTITNAKKEVLPGVQIILSIQDSLSAATMTDENGTFVFSKLHKGEYTIQAAFPGYITLEQPLNLSHNQNSSLTLIHDMNVNLEAVEVVANRNDRVKRTATGQIFYLSEKAKNSGDPYRALKEIPRLTSNEALQKITMEDGTSPLILINGNRINSGVAPIDPKEIESVEVMDVVSARYLRTGTKHIINIKLKEKTAPYSFFQLMTRHDVPLREGMGAIYFEVGNPRFSLYGRAAGGYLHNDKSEVNGWQKDEGYYKQNTATNKKNNNDQLGELLFKWRMGTKDYMIAQIYGRQQLDKANSWGNGIYTTDENQDYDFNTATRDNSYILTGSLYHKHSFTPRSILETTFSYNQNGNQDSSERNENYMESSYQSFYKYRNKRNSGSLNLDYSLDFRNGNSLNIGNETNYTNDRIHEITQEYPIFHHREWGEYLYSAFSGKIRKVSYMISIGAEGIWLKAGNASNQYFKPRAALSGSYAFNDHHSIELNYTLTNQAPEIGQLNPYNTSTDSLEVIKGKPDLLPIQNHRIDASYTFNKAGWYLTPSISYNIYTDMIEASGYTDNGIYIQSYQNTGRFKTLSAGGTLSYRINKIGSISVYAAHNVDYFSGAEAKKSFSYGGNTMFSHKKWTLNVDVSHRNYLFTAISRTKQKTPDYSLLQIIYNFTKDFYISAAIQYFIGTSQMEVSTHSSTYRSFVSRRMTDQSMRPWILLRYTFRKNSKQKIDIGNVVKSKEQGISLQK